MYYVNLLKIQPVYLPNPGALPLSKVTIPLYGRSADPFFTVLLRAHRIFFSEWAKLQTGRQLAA